MFLMSGRDVLTVLDPIVEPLDMISLAIEGWAEADWITSVPTGPDVCPIGNASQLASMDWANHLPFGVTGGVPYGQDSFYVELESPLNAQIQKSASSPVTMI